MNYKAFVVVAAAVSLLGMVGCSSTPTAKPAAPAASATPAPGATDAAAKAAAPAESKGDVLKCKRDADERSVEIEAVEKKSCKVWYSKYGQRSNIASSANGTSHCNDVRNKIKSNLESAGFKCQ